MQTPSRISSFCKRTKAWKSLKNHTQKLDSQYQYFYISYHIIFKKDSTFIKKIDKSANMSVFIQLIKIAIYSKNSLNSIYLKIFLHHIRFLQIKNCEFNSFKDKKRKMRVFQSKIILSHKKVTLYSPMLK